MSIAFPAFGQSQDRYGSVLPNILKAKRQYGGHGTRKIPQMIGAEKALPRHVVSMSGDGAFTMLMGDTSGSQCSVDA
jgi:hypothetical protein